MELLAVAALCIAVINAQQGPHHRYPPPKKCCEREAESHIRGPKVYGWLKLKEDCNGLKITGTLKGFYKPVYHGFHVHEFGDIWSKRCDSTGPHFNLHKTNHGGPKDNRYKRHTGDFGNLHVQPYKMKGYKNHGKHRGYRKHFKADVYIHDKIASLCGDESSIIGRALVVHADEDDLGRKYNLESKTTGNSGARIGCGVINIPFKKPTYEHRPTYHHK